MQLCLGIKSDPIEHRYSHEWLFELMAELRLRYLQLGSFPELYLLEDGFFRELRREAERRGITIKSCFTTHRELGGFLAADPFLERAARRAYERYIEVAALLGADSVGGNAGSVYRDRMGSKQAGLECYLRHMKELMALARRRGLKALHLEPMSCLAEPPALPEELRRVLAELDRHHRENPETTVPVRLCSDIGHGVADRSGRVLYDNWTLFEQQIPWMGEFHFKNTDARFDATFGFSAEERRRGIIDLRRLRDIIEANRDRFPVELVVGYLEMSGPKLGRDYSDYLLPEMLRESVAALQEGFGAPQGEARRRRRR
jgi:sugar phosphate isomerase/epimerase